MSLRISVQTRVFVLLPIVAVAVGCGPAGREIGPTGTVRGTVTYKGKPVPEGSRLVLVSESGEPGSALVGAEGRYRIDGTNGQGLPIGMYRVAVMPPGEQASGGGTMNPQDYEKYMSSPTPPPAAKAKPPGALPDKYQSTATSGKTLEINEGAGTQDIKLE